jgi:hypothetical protein
MRICDAPSFETWTPSVDSRPAPTWSLLRFEGWLLCNSMEWADWTDNPVQLEICEACGSDGCASGGYVHVSRLGQFVLWTAPQIDRRDAWQVSQFRPHPALTEFGAIAINERAWDDWRGRGFPLPPPSAITASNGTAVPDAWLLGAGRPTDPSSLVGMLRERVLACDTLAPSDAVDRVERWVGRLLDIGPTPTTVAMRHPRELDASVETLYFDGPSRLDWPAFVLRDGVEFPLLDRDHALVEMLPARPS